MAGFATIAALLYAVFLGRAHPFNTFMAVEIIFLVAAISAWSFRSIRLERDHIVSTVFFVITTKYPFRDVKKVTFERFGVTEDFSIGFHRHPKLHLTNFDRSDLSEIIRRIREVRPDVEIPIQWR